MVIWVRWSNPDIIATHTGTVNHSYKKTSIDWNIKIQVHKSIKKYFKKSKTSYKTEIAIF